MDHHALADRMARFPAALSALLEGLDHQRSLWRPDERAWSILEIVCHLADEEAADFGPRLFRTLADPSAAWDPIDPEAWAIDRDYRSRDLTGEIQRFAALREVSIFSIWALTDTDWTAAHEHPVFGPISAGELMTGWCAHDALHLRQIAKRLAELAVNDGGFSHRYAGDW